MSESKRVLVVDDDESIRAIVEMALQDEGYVVRAAEHGAAALALIDAWPPDVILLDMKMPVMDGWTMAAAYRQRPRPHAPIVVLTAAQDATRWAAEIAADDVLAKPFDLDNLFAVVDHHTAAGAEAAR